MLKVSIKLKDVFATLRVETILTIEDRQLFAVVMGQIGKKHMQSVTATTTEVGDWYIQYTLNPTSCEHCIIEARMTLTIFLMKTNLNLSA